MVGSLLVLVVNDPSFQILEHMLMSYIEANKVHKIIQCIFPPNSALILKQPCIVCTTMLSAALLYRQQWSVHLSVVCCTDNSGGRGVIM